MCEVGTSRCMTDIAETKPLGPGRKWPWLGLWWSPRCFMPTRTVPWFLLLSYLALAGLGRRVFKCGLLAGRISNCWEHVWSVAMCGAGIVLASREVICWMFVASRFVLEDLGAKRFWVCFLRHFYGWARVTSFDCQQSGRMGGCAERYQPKAWQNEPCATAMVLQGKGLFIEG